MLLPFYSKLQNRVTHFYEAKLGEVDPGNVKKVMKTHSEEYGKPRETLPL
jgi:hypothetical protein